MTTPRFEFTRPGDLGKQTFVELRKALSFYAIEGNRYAVENIVREMASRRNTTAPKMASAVKRGEF